VRSKAHIKGHPIHPILVTFPIAFFVSAFISDLILIITDRVFFGQMAKYLEAGGIIFGVIAAVPGIIDYFGAVPPESSAMKRATKHGLLNISMLFIFIMALLLRMKSDVSTFTLLILEGAGVVMLTVSGWLGGTLVHRNQIGVDHRYAGAGKWKEEIVNSDGKIELKNMDQLGINQMKLLHVNNKRIVIGRSESGLVSFDDSCTHRGGSLADGVMICGTVQCPWHGSQFNCQTGTVNAGPAKEKIKTYKIEVVDNRYYLQL
jgi:uncharacterized membrane protein/nitrite reductase/ring-hydroxylating ferredoxin subunit